jgi:hypothetical protein
MRYPGITFAVLMLLAVAPSTAFARQEQASSSTAGAVATNGTAEAGATGAPTIDPDALGINIERIQRAVGRVPAIRPESTRPVFRIQVFSRKPTIDDILGPDWRKGPTPMGAMSHQEFLNLVTPEAVRGYAAFDNKQAITVAATSFALQWALQKAVDKLKDAKTERAKQAAQKEVAEALAALKKARLEAGLPDK